MRNMTDADGPIFSSAQIPQRALQTSHGASHGLLGGFHVSCGPSFSTTTFANGARVIWAVVALRVPETGHSAAAFAPPGTFTTAAFLVFKSYSTWFQVNFGGSQRVNTERSDRSINSRTLTTSQI
jgi:hypothetical protein